VGDPDRNGDTTVDADRRGEDLHALFDEVIRTRGRQRQEQARRGASNASMLPAREASLQALQDYIDALDVRGWPVPPKMRLDLNLLRAICNVRGYS
jgi:hypothetical protein